MRPGRSWRRAASRSAPARLRRPGAARPRARASAIRRSRSAVGSGTREVRPRMARSPRSRSDTGTWYRIRVPPRRRGPDPRVGFLRAEQQVPGRIGAEGRRVEPVGAVVVRGGEPAGEPEEVGAPGEARPGGVEQPLGVGDQLAERLPRGSREAAPAPTHRGGVIPGSELLPVGRVRPCARSTGVPSGRVSPGSLASVVQQRIDQLQHQADPVGDGRRVPVDVGRDQVDVDQQQFLELRVLLAAEVVAAEDAGQVGVEIPDAVGEQALVAEDRGDLAGQRVGVDLAAGPASARMRSSDCTI